MGWRERSAVAVSVLSALMLVTGLGLAFLAPTGGALLFLAIGLLAAPPAAGLGLLVLRRHSTNIVGLLLALTGLSVSVTATKEIAWRVLADRPSTAASFNWLVAALNESAWWGFTVFGLLLLYFPDGKLPSRRWRWAPPVLIVCTAINQIYGAVSTEPFPRPLENLARPYGPPPTWFEVLASVAFLLNLLLVIASATSLVVRFRRAKRIGRAQIKWLALAGAGIPLYPFLCLAEIAIWNEPKWFSVTVIVASVVGIPMATGVAILRYNLYDVDKALAGTVTWVMMTAVLFGIYGTTSVVTGLVLNRGSAAAAAAVTALSALSLSPLRLRVQRQVDQRLYPLRRAAFMAIDGLHRSTSAGTMQPEELQQVLRDALRDPKLRVGFRVPGADGFVDTQGHVVQAIQGAPIELGGVQIGALVPGDAGIASPELLRQIAGRSTTLVEVVRLRLELGTALRDVESSRARLVHAGYQERRRLERDLHDGAQQRLVSLGMALRLAQRHLDEGKVDLDALLDQSVAELGTAVAELRQIAHGLRPGSLDDGLSAALAGLMRTVPIIVDMDVSADPLPDDIATTAYFVVSEAVANAVKHAQAERISICVTNSDGQVFVRVTDDGLGGAALGANSGLKDRVAALRGTLHVDSPAGLGTLIEATLPCG
ncbi:MAG TPA: histidine kinase [Acidimicrobiales bacterium]|nr:histidine kinase [Acidimicrobiales bacterium]